MSELECEVCHWTGSGDLYGRFALCGIINSPQVRVILDLRELGVESFRSLGRETEAVSLV